LTKVKDALKAMDSEANHDPRLQWDIARIYDMLAVIRGSGGTGMGDRASAVANAQKAREIMERLVPLDPHNEAKAVTLASAYGHVADNTSDPAAAIDTCRRMLQLVQQRISGQNFIGMTGLGYHCLISHQIESGEPRAALTSFADLQKTKVPLF